MRNAIRSRGWGGRAWTMVRARGGAARAAAAAALGIALACAGGGAAGAWESGGEGSIDQTPRVSIVRRAVMQDQGAWVVDFAIRNETAAGVVVVPSELEARVEGWVSNSRIAGHARPLLARTSLSGSAGGTAEGDVIASKAEAGRCRERLSLSIWSDDAPPDNRGQAREKGSGTFSPAGEKVPDPFSLFSLAPISLAPGATGRVRLRLEHQHVVFGGYDPLLGVRTIDLRVGSETYRDVVALDRERYLAQPDARWPEPPEDRRDPERYVSAPDSLHLEAHAAGRQYYRFPDQPVRHGARMRLSFWYLIAFGTAGDCRVRFSQYKDTPSSCRVLPSGGFDQELTVVGRWTKVEKIIHIESEATTAALDFRISSDANLGEMWIDDAELSPIAPDALAAGP